MWNSLNILMIDNYVLQIIKSNGWTEKRDFYSADEWISEIEKAGFHCFDCARSILHLFGGLKIKEYSPKICQNFLKKNLPNDSHKEQYLRTLKIIKELKIDGAEDKYTGATFTFDAIDALSDQEIVLDPKITQDIVSDDIFPIGTVEPDGISYVSEEGKIFVVFNDSIFLAGKTIEDYLNTAFIKAKKPILIYKVADFC